MKDTLICPRCFSRNTIKRGKNIQCKDPNHPEGEPRYSTLRESLELMVLGGTPQDEVIVDDGQTRMIQTEVPEKMSDEELLKFLGVDQSQYRIDRVKYSRSPTFRKNKKSAWVTVAGKSTGYSRDYGDMAVKYVYSVQVWLSRKTEEIKANTVVEGILARLEEKSPKVPKRQYKQTDDGLLLEMMIPDIHIGRTTSTHESGENYDIDLAFKVVSEAVESMLAKAEKHRIAKVLFLMGNDFFNVDNEHKTTANDTPQQEEKDFATTFLAGERMLAYLVNRLTEVAPLDLMFIPGNHDPHRLFYLGRVAQALYAKNKNVTITNEIKERQYYKFGRNLFGFTHGDRIKLDKLPALMPLEIVRQHPDWWAQTDSREWHMGHFHTKKEMEWIAYDDIGVTLRFFRSLTAADRWHFRSGYVGSPKAAESILWTPDDGLFSQFPATIRSELYIQ